MEQVDRISGRAVLPLAIVGLVAYAVGRFGLEEEQEAKESLVDEPETVSEEIVVTEEMLQDQPNIILITVDTLRADTLGAYGHSEDTSPWLDSLAERGVLAERAFGGSSWTVPSMATIFTGLYPFQHGVQNGLVVKGNVTDQPVLPGVHTTLAEQLKEAGYTTFGIATNRHLSQMQGFGQGFDFFHNQGFVSGYKLHEVLSDWATEIQWARPYFLWLHFFDPHDRYQARRPWVEQFDLNAAAHIPEIGTQDARERDRRLRKWSDRVIREIRSNDDAKEPVALQTLKVLYDSEVRYADHWVEESLKLLKLDPDTVIAFSSDHGEEFMDHGDFGHRTTLYNEQVVVPLVISAPGRIPEGTRLKEPVSLVDLKPTLVHLATGKAPDVDKNGARSMVKRLKGKASNKNDTLLMSTRRAGQTLSAVVQGNLKLIHNLALGTNELYDLDADWSEKHDLSATRTSDVETMTATMMKLRETYPTFDPGTVEEELSGETLEQLRGLGYVDDDGLH